MKLSFVRVPVMCNASIIRFMIFEFLIYEKNINSLLQYILNATFEIEYRSEVRNFREKKTVHSSPNNIFSYLLNWRKEINVLLMY